MEWMPIETAPKDGTLVLIVTAHASPISGYFAAYWSTEWEMWRFHNEGFVRDPTHWVPLPPPPTSPS